MSIRIINADVLAGLAQLADESVQCCVTSPPYWGLRDYNVEGQIGLEPTPEAFVAKLALVFREVRRVLRSDGVCWINLGDSYATSGTRGYHGGSGIIDGNASRRTTEAQSVGYRATPVGLKPKDLVGVPWRVAFALQVDGWYLRQEIIWAKPNPMPESVTDRCTKAHEHIFLLTKSARYFYDAEAIKEGSVTNDPRRPYTSEGAKQLDGRKEWKSGERRDGDDFGSRNKRSVWTIATQPYAEAHFATFPEELPETCIKAGSSAYGCCAKCGTPWERETESEFIPQQDVSLAKGMRGAGNQKPLDASNGKQGFPRGSTARATTGWRPGCGCVADAVPCTILDPFAGAGTTGLVADKLGRNAILIELSAEYAAMSASRIKGDCPMFASVEVTP